MMLWDKNTRRIGFAESMQLFLYVILGNLAVQFAGSVIIILFESAALYINYAVMAALQFCFVGIVIGFLGKKKATIDVYPFGGTERSAGASVTDILCGVAIALTALLTFYPIAGLFGRLLDFIGFNEQSAFTVNDVASGILIVFTTCICAPIGEELVFRGVLLGGLGKRFGKWSAVVLCGLGFSLFHMNPAQTVYQFFLGCAFALIVCETRSLISGIAAHFTNNLIAVIMVIAPAFGEFVERIMSVFLYGYGIIAVLPLTAAGVGVVILLSRSRRRGATLTVTETKQSDANPEEERREKRWGLIMFLAALGICIFMWILTFVVGILNQ